MCPPARAGPTGTPIYKVKKFCSFSGHTLKNHWYENSIKVFKQMMTRIQGEPKKQLHTKLVAILLCQTHVKSSPIFKILSLQDFLVNML